MTTVTLATHCHNRDLPRLHAPGVLEELISCHAYPFNEILVTHQRCGDLPYTLPDDNRIRVLEIKGEDYPAILGRMGIPHNDPELSRITHGWSGPHFYSHHNVNHITELFEARSDYIVFNDADCRIISQPADQSWVTKAVELLERYPEIFIVSPSDGGHEFNRTLPDGTRLVEITSQQLFIARRERLLEMNFTHLPWNGLFDAPGGPFPEFYGLFEGHLWRWMRHKGGLYRAILPEQWRYWHGEYH